MNRRLTLAQAIVAFLSNQYSSQDGETEFFEGCFGILGTVTWPVWDKLEQDRRLRYYLCRNEQTMVHTAAALAKRVCSCITACATSGQAQPIWSFQRSAGND